MKPLLLTILAVASPFYGIWTVKSLEKSYFFAALVGSLPIMAGILIYILG